MAFAGLLLLPSCEKQNRLMDEAKKTDVEIQKYFEELTAIDAKMAVYGRDADLAIIAVERQNADWARKNTALENELAAKSKKCTDGEAAMKNLRPRVDSYKAKYSR